MKRLWITGYRSYELGVFSENDPKVKVIKSALKDQISQKVADGYRWLITGAQLGTEQWSVAVGHQLKKSFHNSFKIAVMRPFLNLGQNWNASNKLRLIQTIHRADFSRSVSNSGYQSPQQLINYQCFMLDHTEGALLIYDPDHPGKTKYAYRSIQNYQRRHRYTLTMVDFDDLQDVANEYEEIYEEKRNHGLNSF